MLDPCFFLRFVILGLDGKTDLIGLHALSSCKEALQLFWLGERDHGAFPSRNFSKEIFVPHEGPELQIIFDLKLRL